MRYSEQLYNCPGKNNTKASTMGKKRRQAEAEGERKRKDVLCI
jgi:hypothetical protein